ncbi:hypothetical protein [Qipengyuania sp. JC766]|uniref:hypothetical protein n=1 Tax=Qipengyuania sp. JC766 TaxID=3232139 RepID=UPI0034581207
MRPILTTAACLSLAACTTYGEGQDERAEGCPAYDSRNWTAWIDRMPGPGSRPTLNISGEVDMPTPGYTVRLVAGPADRAQPPGLRFRLEATASDGMVTQVITPTEVRYREPTPYSRIREIIITCGDGTLATIPDVMITE